MVELLKIISANLYQLRLTKKKKKKSILFNFKAMDEIERTLLLSSLLTGNFDTKRLLLLSLRRPRLLVCVTVNGIFR
jgi:hypothetical protein